MENEKEFQARLLAAFKVESEEHINSITNNLLKLERITSHEDYIPVIETVFRSIHSLKGAARAVNLKWIEALCKSIEDVFAVCKKFKSKLSSEQLDILLKGIEIITIYIQKPESDPKIFRDLIAKIDNIKIEEKAQPTQPPITIVEQIKPEVKSLDTIRVSTSKLNDLLIQTEEMIPVKVTIANTIKVLRQMLDSFNLWNPKNLQEKIMELSESTEDLHRSYSQQIEKLLSDIKQVLMLPFSSFLEGIPKMARELSRDQGKEVNIEITGGEVEIDRRILEAIKDPIIHMVRNAIDHGIEMPKERISINKLPVGKIKIRVSTPASDKIELIISDDGHGIDIKSLKEVVIKKGIITESTARDLDEQTFISYIFQSDISTSPIITDISGRGLGMAIVQERVEILGGKISVNTSLNKGTYFKIILPVTIASFRGIFTRVSEHVFVFPTVSVNRIKRVKKDELQTIENRHTILENHKTIPIVSLGEVLELSISYKKSSDSDYIQLVIVESGNHQIAFTVDEILDEEECIVKHFGSQLARVKAISGATIIGRGRVVPILNIQDLISLAKNSRALAQVKETQKEENIEPEIPKSTVLVVDDSVTSRILLKNVIESSGYKVKTAVDGLDALSILKTEKINLVVSDIEMPRMNGFSLTEKIRNEKNISETPIILVTARESKEDRERGIDSGANAYIIKRSFDQDNLLSIIKRLI
ncbi:MAG: response regulator [Desulfobacterales bacterium]|nr:response regulator [Desulfobacterales bacterium]